MKSYHIAWLAAHPDRTENWLRERLADGFQIHHVDGDHTNDAPLNLLLIDGVDHLNLHAGALVDGIKAWRRKPRVRRAKPAPDHSEGRELYGAMGKRRGSWSDFAKEYYGGRKPEDRLWSDIGVRMQAKAKAFARHSGLNWPPRPS